MQSYTWNILQTGREMKNPELNKDEAKMTTMQRREIRKPIDEEIDILTWLPKSRLNSQVDHSVISARTTTAVRKYRSHCKFSIQIDTESKVGNKINNNQLTKSITGRTWRGASLKTN